MLADLGGAENLSTLERLAASHVSVADAMVTDLGVRWLRGDPVDPTAFATLVNTFNRSAAALGWTRRAKDVTPKDDVSQWIEGRLAAKRAPAGASVADASAETAVTGEVASEAFAPSETVSDSGAAPHDAVAHTADCASAPASSGGGHG